MDGRVPAVAVPRALAESASGFFGPEWVAALPGLVVRRCEEWGLRVTGAPMHGQVALVVPVRRGDGSAAALKVQPVDGETAGEPAALRAWDGGGAVRLLEALDPSRSLVAAGVPEALAAIGALLARLNAAPAPAGMRSLAPLALEGAQRAKALAASRTGPDRRLLADLASRAREMAADPGDRLLHWDLHYGNVLAPLPDSGRGRWLAGDPGFELLPALRNRWAEAVATGDAGHAVRRRFDLLTEAACVDRDRARAWTLVRVMRMCVWELESGTGRLPQVPVAVAAALSR
nr:aminoglycoside phosphotransferase family protein [Nocardiopsis sp. CNT312]